MITMITSVQAVLTLSEPPGFGDFRKIKSSFQLSY